MDKKFFIETKDGKMRYPNLFKRSLEISNLPKNIRKARVFVGMRRVGKIYLMYQHMEDLLSSGVEKTKLLYINFEGSGIMVILIFFINP